MKYNWSLPQVEEEYLYDEEPVADEEEYYEEAPQQQEEEPAYEEDAWVRDNNALAWELLNRGVTEEEASQRYYSSYGREQSNPYSSPSEGRYTATGATGRVSYHAGKGSIDPQEAVAYYESRGIAPHVARGIVGNAMQESGLNPYAVGDGGKARGIFQWHPDRWQGLVRFANQQGKDPYDPYVQLEYAANEPGESSRALQHAMRTQTPGEAAYAWAKVYERPKVIDKNRIQYAQSLQQGGEVPYAQVGEVVGAIGQVAGDLMGLGGTYMQERNRLKNNTLRAVGNQFQRWSMEPVEIPVIPEQRPEYAQEGLSTSVQRPYFSKNLIATRPTGYFAPEGILQKKDAKTSSRKDYAEYKRQLQGLEAVHTIAGEPNIKFQSEENPSLVGKLAQIIRGADDLVANYNPITKTSVIGKEDIGEYMAELSHAYQQTHGLNTLSREAGTAIRRLFGSDVYNDGYSTEYEAHSVIEPKLWDVFDWFEQDPKKRTKILSKIARKQGGGYAQSGWVNPNQPPQFTLQPTTPSQSLIPQYNPASANAVSAAGLQTAPGQDAYYNMNKYFPHQEAPASTGGFNLLTPLKKATQLAARFIPSSFDAATAATMATGLLGRLEANRQRNQLWNKYQFQQDKAQFINAGRGMEYNPLYAQQGY